MATIHRPLIFSGTRVRRLPAGDFIEGSGVIADGTNSEGSAITKGQPVYISGNNQYSLALANSVDTSRVIGLVIDDSTDDGETMHVLLNGELEATTSQWDAVTGETGGLAPGGRYFLSPTTAGMLTRTPPSTQGQIAMPVLEGDSPTKAIIRIGPLVIL